MGIFGANVGGTNKHWISANVIQQIAEHPETNANSHERSQILVLTPPGTSVVFLHCLARVISISFADLGFNQKTSLYIGCVLVSGETGPDWRRERHAAVSEGKRLFTTNIFTCRYTLY